MVDDGNEGGSSVGVAEGSATAAKSYASYASIEFLGLVDLVSDQCSPPNRHCCVLMPNAKVPNAKWIPKALRFDTPHAARLVVLHGNWCWQGPGSLKITGFPADECLPAFSLDGLEFRVVEHCKLSADRAEAPNCNDGVCVPPSPDTTLNILGAMDALVDRMRRDWHAPFLGEVEPGLIDGRVSPHRARITSRMRIECGHLCTSNAWSDGGSTRPFLFQVHPPKTKLIRTYRAYLGQSMMLHLPGVKNKVSLCFRSLETGREIGRLTVRRKDGPIRLAVKNLDKDDYEAGLHFLAHYMIRKRWRWICRARYPDTSNWVDPSGLDPQCTPGDAKG